ncbi:hypothetical protein ACIQC5_22985 [Paenarthrobacter sp. NPDC092416]|uniref:hypothetical protein n=1 Tax=Paenarthrobacter sp. NPDC092416 TaxID=3364386 RepID=UPI0037F5A192
MSRSLAPSILITGSTAAAPLRVHKARRLGICQSLLFDEEAFSLVAPAGPAEPHNHRRQSAGLAGPAEPHNHRRQSAGLAGPARQGGIPAGR